MATGMRRCIGVRERVGEERFLDVHFEDTRDDPFGVVDRIYGFIDCELTPEARSAMEDWLAENRRADRPPHEYTLDTFGFTEAGLDAQFSAYTERFLTAEAQSQYRLVG